MANGGCEYEKYGRYCGKLTDKSRKYCPKHTLIINEEENVQALKMEHARRGKERKKAMREALATSPLRGYNPSFDEKRKSGYEQ